MTRMPIGPADAEDSAISDSVERYGGDVARRVAPAEGAD